MKKIPCIFIRDHDHGGVINEINPACQWVFDGEGRPTRKYDGTCCMIGLTGKWWKRRTTKNPQKEMILADYDPVTGKHFGWVPIDFDDPANKWHKEAYDPLLEPGTYELVGPKVQGNAEDIEIHMLVRHGAVTVPEPELTYEGIKEQVLSQPFEGIVWHHPDGRKAKIRRNDFL